MRRESARLGWRSATVVVVPAAVVLFAACQTPTSMQIVVSTDVDCSALSGEHLAHIIAGTPDAVTEVLDPSSTKRCTAEGNVGELVLLPREDENAAVAVKVVLGVGRQTSQCGTEDPSSDAATPEERAWAGCIVARRRLGFVEGEALVVEVPLHVDCIGVACDEAAFTTCVKGGRCVPADLDCQPGTPCDEGDLEPTAASASASSSTGDGGASFSSGGDGGAGGSGAGGEGGGGLACVAPEDCADPPACFVAGCVDGRCTPVPELAGTPCDDGACDGDGTCVACTADPDCEATCEVPHCVEGRCENEHAPDGSECPDGTCTDGVCGAPPTCSNDEHDGEETDVDCGGPDCGDCEDGQGCGDANDCASNLCAGGECVGCDVDLDCPIAQHCDDGVCTDDLDDGGICDSPGDCDSGICTSGGRCCDVVCEGACQECSTGECRGVTGVTPSCPDDACANGCEGGPNCVYEDAGRVCEGPSCSSGFERATLCDGFGSCNVAFQDECAPFVCGVDTCGTTCGGDDDCVAPATCVGNRCRQDCNGIADCPDPGPCATVACTGQGCVYTSLADGTDCGSTCDALPGKLDRKACRDGSCLETNDVDCCGLRCGGNPSACLGACANDGDCIPGKTCNQPGPNGICVGGSGLGNAVPGQCGIVEEL